MAHQNQLRNGSNVKPASTVVVGFARSVYSIFYLSQRFLLTITSLVFPVLHPQRETHTCLPTTLLVPCSTWTSHDHQQFRAEHNLPYNRHRSLLPSLSHASRNARLPFRINTQVIAVLCVHVRLHNIVFEVQLTMRKPSLGCMHACLYRNSETLLFRAPVPIRLTNRTLAVFLFSVESIIA